MDWIAGQPRPAQTRIGRRWIQCHVNNLLWWLEPFISSAVIVTQTYVLRMIVLLLSLPAFLLFGAVGLAEGLMRRDLRRWGGGREPSFAHGAHGREWTMPIRDWKAAMNQFIILYGDRVPV
jgi:hypothetical protein